MKYVLAAFSLFAVARAARCDADNCLRAVRASGFPTRQGTADCSSFFRTTVTPAVVTITATNTEYATASATQDATATSTVYETATQTIYHTATDIIPATVIVTNTAYADLVKRQQTEIPSNIPKYASLCSGAARYSSACSCVGVTATTIVLPASTATVFADETLTQVTVTTTITVATDYVTVVDATNTVETTDATLTRTTIVATATDTVRIPLSARFAVQVQGSQWSGQYFHREPDNRELSVRPLEAGETPSVFYLADGIVYSSESGRPILGYPDWITNPSIQSSFLLFLQEPSSSPWPFVLVGDALKPYDFATPSVELRAWVCPADSQFPGKSVITSHFNSPGFGSGGGACQVVSLKAVQVPF